MDANIAPAGPVAARLMDVAWEARDIKTIRLLPMHESMAIARAPAEGSGPLLIGDDTDCPGGITLFDWSKYPYRNIRRPIWPLDPLCTQAARWENSKA